MAALDPELDVAVAAMVEAGARFVVVGGFSVIANRFIRATEDVDFLVPDDAANDRRVLAALIQLAGLSSIVGFKRLAGRPRDRNDLLGLAEIHGELPVEPIPGLDS